jgi:uncharacterized protein (DUF1778 family)
MASKTKRLNLRLTRQQDALLRSAAVSRGESAHDFVVRHAVEAAEMELADRRVFAIDDDAWTLAAWPSLDVAGASGGTGQAALETFGPRALRLEAFAGTGLLVGEVPSKNPTAEGRISMSR